MRMDSLLDGLIMYFCFLPILTFHELAHAWVAWKCGDNTARSQGRISLNPIVHMDLVGTVILPLLAISLGAADSKIANFIIGWGKPVPVDPSNLRSPRRDDTLIALAGPVMNILLAIVLVGLGKLCVLAGVPMKNVGPLVTQMGVLSLFLCFFNLLPIPPLDGSHVVKNAIGMSYETYWRLSQYGFIIVIIAMNIPMVRSLVAYATFITWLTIRAMFRF